MAFNGIDLRPYDVVLRERMEWYDVDEDGKDASGSNGDDDDDDYSDNEFSCVLDPRAVTETVRVMTLNREFNSGTFVGTDLAGRELFHIQCDERMMTIHTLIAIVADYLGPKRLETIHSLGWRHGPRLRRPCRRT
eukprot:TRINITY_DN59572_c0_g1_i1.p2 TRINITY_DN59572_c0_g1~~TRINITY_DN59572_c0_g1_i1.p2  ORF type:complete len:135 (-),score=9.03 TRINITY_DN59572_c0_g1_i1:154-558(-)